MKLSKEAKKSYLDFCGVNDTVDKSECHYQSSDDYGTYGPGDTSLSPTKEEEAHPYQVPKNFKLKNGLNPSIMKEIEKKKQQEDKRKSRCIMMYLFFSSWKMIEKKSYSIIMKKMRIMYK